VKEIVAEPVIADAPDATVKATAQPPLAEPTI
jgi:hypothetical protein